MTDSGTQRTARHARPISDASITHKEHDNMARSTTNTPDASTLDLDQLASAWVADLVAEVMAGNTSDKDNGNDIERAADLVDSFASGDVGVLSVGESDIIGWTHRRTKTDATQTTMDEAAARINAAAGKLEDRPVFVCSRKSGEPVTLINLRVDAEAAKAALAKIVKRHASTRKTYLRAKNMEGVARMDAKLRDDAVDSISILQRLNPAQ